MRNVIPVWAFKHNSHKSLKYFSNWKFCSIIYLSQENQPSQNVAPRIYRMQDHKYQLLFLISSFFLFLSGFIMSLLSTFPWKYLNNISIWCCGNFATIHTIFIWQFSFYHFYYHCYLSLIPAVKYICKYDILFYYFFMRNYDDRQSYNDCYRCVRGHMRKSMPRVWQGCLIY